MKGFKEKILEDIELGNIQIYLAEMGRYRFSSQLSKLEERLNHYEPSANEIDVEQFLALDIIAQLRRILDCPPKMAIVNYAEQIARVLGISSDKAAEPREDYGEVGLQRTGAQDPHRDIRDHSGNLPDAREE